MDTKTTSPEAPAAKQKPPAPVDLRSDTVTRPTPEMRRAMAEAEVGDDVYGEDPTVNRLEARAAQMFEREAAIFVPTGTMGNQIAIRIHTQHGQEVICEERAHIINLESATIAAFSGCMPVAIHGEDGALTWAQIKRKIAPRIYYRSQTALIVLENTLNLAGGTIFSQEAADEMPDPRRPSAACTVAPTGGPFAACRPAPRERSHRSGTWSRQLRHAGVSIFL